MPGFDHDPIFLPVVIALMGFLIGFTKGGFNTLFALFTRWMIPHINQQAFEWIIMGLLIVSSFLLFLQSR